MSKRRSSQFDGSSERDGVSHHQDISIKSENYNKSSIKKPLSLIRNRFVAEVPKKEVNYEDHSRAKNFLAEMRNKRIEDEKLLNKSTDGSVRGGIRDVQMRKVLNNKNMTDYERIDAVKRRAEQLESLANREE